MTRWSIRRYGMMGELIVDGIRGQFILWLSWISAFDASMILPQPIMSIGTGDPKRPVLYLYRGHLYKAPFGQSMFAIENAGAKQRANFNPRYTIWWDSVSAPARIAMEISHRIAIGLDVPAKLWNRFIQGGTKSIQNRTANADQIKSSRYIPQWVKIEVVLRDGGRCRECGCDDVTQLEFDHLTSFADGGVSDDPDNIGLRCLPCNRRKGRRSEVRA